MSKNFLKGLQAEHFMRPGDRVAIEKLRKYTPFKRITQKFLEEGMEEDAYRDGSQEKDRLHP